ncbi:UNVERIFIED_CONTAM: cytochrome and DOMON domain-containing protein [Sesamum radiatum]|uniref:Cytochrome and DOMON domain-containing protein n=1 Tax=Sesamum radiatum TaxID=300843 RepID=A0AAW2KGD3_SESRA
MFRPVLIISVLFSLYIASHAQSCAKYNFASNQIFSSCNDLPYLNSFLHWNYDQSAKTVKIAYRHTGVSSSRWVAWAINPSGQGMVGAQALVAFQKSDGTMRAYTAPVAGYQTQLQEGDLSFPVSDLSATYARNEIVIFATLKLDGLNSTVNQVWQEGPLSGDSPAMHPTSGPNVQSMGTVNLLSGETGAAAGAGNSKTKKKNVPKGVPFADPAWFYLHATCQTSAYIIGVAGWATGLRLGSQSAGVQYTSHRVSALLLRPKKEHKYRFYWNIYHHLIGYSVIVLSIINIFKGFNSKSRGEMEESIRWNPDSSGFHCCNIGSYTWYVVVKRKKSSRPHKMPNGVNGTMGTMDTEQGHKIDYVYLEV